ncbi:MAG: CopG family transcriptional regulator [Candidatus Omnitrophica bacterium]|nr:CopG family transcriptional regulator [Candidatus Omnitrophota bacterium]
MKTSNKKISPREKASKTMKRVNVDFPPLMLKQLDAEADRIGVTRTSLIKMWLSEKLKLIS